MLNEKMRIRLDQIDKLRSLIPSSAVSELDEMEKRILDASIIDLFNKARKGAINIQVINQFLLKFINPIPIELLEELLEINQRSLETKSEVAEA